MMRRPLASTVLAAAAVFTATAAWAHHSTAEFDYGKTITVEGVVKEVQWTNPHSYLQVLAKGADGATVQWGIEIGAPALNLKLGWRKDSVKIGDRITLTVAPARDGRTFGTLRFLTYADGRKLNGVAASINFNAGQ